MGFFTEKNRKIIHLVTVFLFSYFFLFYGIGQYSLKDPDEGRYAEIPREMLELGDYLRPHLNYVPYFEKPPLFYWIILCSYELFGVNEFSFRFPNAVLAFLCVLTVYFFAFKWFGEWIALASALILSSSFGFFAMTRIVTLDMAFTTFLTISLFSFNSFYLERKKFYLWSFYFFCSLATLTKGFAAPLLLGLTIVVFLVTNKRLSFIKEMEIWRGIVIYCVITGPYLFYMSIKEKDFFYFFFVDQHILRYLTKKHNREEPLYYFLPVLFIAMYPYSVFIPRAIWRTIQKKEAKLLVLWSLVAFLFFSMSGSKLPTYILPILPCLSVVLGHLCINGDVNVKPERGIYKFIFFISFVLSSLLFFTGKLNVNPQLKEIVYDFKIMFIGLSIVFLFLLIIFHLKKSFSLKQYFTLLFGLSFSILCFILMNIGSLDTIRTTKPLAQLISQKKGKDDIIVSYGAFYSTLPFYTRSPVLVTDFVGELEFGLKHQSPGSHAVLTNNMDLHKIFTSKKKIFCVLSVKKLNHFQERFGSRSNILMCTREKCLLTNFR